MDRFTKPNEPGGANGPPPPNISPKSVRILSSFSAFLASSRGTLQRFSGGPLPVGCAQPRSMRVQAGRMHNYGNTFRRE